MVEKEEIAIKRIASIADSWWKLLTIAVAIILMIYNVSAAWIEIKDNANELKIFKEETLKDNVMRDERADKRYNRAIEMYEELKKAGISLEQELEDHRIEDAYQRGKTDAAMEFMKGK